MTARAAGILFDVMRTDPLRYLDAELDSLRQQGLHRARCHQAQRLAAAVQAGAGQQPRQAVAVITVHVGDEDGAQARQRQRRAQHLVLRALAAVHQVPATRLARLQRQLSASLFMHEGREVFVTFSAGVTAWRAGEALDGALERADRALYEAKRTGKNRTCTA